MHINLCITLSLAQLLFVVAVDKTEIKVSPLCSIFKPLIFALLYVQALCSAIAMALQYLFLSSFMWMLMEGVVLYIILVVVFVQGKEKKYIIFFTILSYGSSAENSDQCIVLEY